MKIDARQIERFLADPGRTRLVLIYGPDNSLVIDRARGLAKRIAGSLDDPFRLAELDADQADRLPEEASAQAFGGGRKVILIRDTGDKQAPAFEAALATKGDALIIATGGDLNGRSKLRGLAEKHTDAAAIACYLPDASSRGPALEAALREAGTTIARDALTLAASRLGGESGALNDAAERLILYAGPGGTLTVIDIDAVLDDQGTASMQDAIDAALTGNPRAADHAISLALDEGAAPVAILRVLLGELSGLRLMAEAIARGASPRDAVAARRPPVFFRRQPTVIKAATNWREPAIIAAIERTLRAEADCKRTGSVPEAICRQTLLGLAQRAAR
ncbi:MAG: DNA polymerase III subunit delta [Acidiphilium sp.]|nr:DNA polymerase III subunit delta [Acidiphilium sp.]MDD4934514.1 DNA polymerase III subunit delta [Acidiphilium sp.]